MKARVHYISRTSVLEFCKGGRAKSVVTRYVRLDAGHTVDVLDDLSPVTSSHCLRVTLVKAAIHDRAAVHRLLVEHRADAVMHFAAWLAVGESVRKPLEYFQNNVAGTLAVLEAMRDAGVKRFIFSSTCAVYGEPATVPIVETLDTSKAYARPVTIEPRCASRVAHGIKWVALCYFMRGAHPEGSSAKTCDEIT